jgi:hypothetical protein
MCIKCRHPARVLQAVEEDAPMLSITNPGQGSLDEVIVWLSPAS